MKDQKINKYSPKVQKAKAKVYLCPILIFVLPHSPSLNLPNHNSCPLLYTKKKISTFPPKTLEETIFIIYLNENRVFVLFLHFIPNYHFPLRYPLQFQQFSPVHGASSRTLTQGQHSAWLGRQGTSEIMEPRHGLLALLRSTDFTQRDNTSASNGWGGIAFTHSVIKELWLEETSEGRYVQSLAQGGSIPNSDKFADSFVQSSQENVQGWRCDCFFEQHVLVLNYPHSDFFPLIIR